MLRVLKKEISIWQTFFSNDAALGAGISVGGQYLSLGVQLKKIKREYSLCRREGNRI